MTNESRALVAQQPQLSMSTWSVIQAIAPTMHQSRLFGVASPEAAAGVMVLGSELGFGLAASFDLIAVVQGKPTLKPIGALALIYRSGELAGMKIEDKPGSCTVWMKRRNGFEYQLTWTIEDARRAGLVKAGGAWETYPANMCRWRCIGYVSDVVFPDVLGGLRRADEMGAEIDTTGNVVDAEWSVAPTQPTAVVAEVVAAPAVTLDDLVSTYGADRVLEAAGGRIPGTLDEVAAAARVLGASNG